MADVFHSLQIINQFIVSQMSFWILLYLKITGKKIGCQEKYSLGDLSKLNRTHLAQVKLKQALSKLSTIFQFMDFDIS